MKSIKTINKVFLALLISTVTINSTHAVDSTDYIYKGLIAASTTGIAFGAYGLTNAAYHLIWGSSKSSSLAIDCGEFIAIITPLSETRFGAFLRCAMYAYLMKGCISFTLLLCNNYSQYLNDKIKRNIQSNDKR